MCKKLMIAAVAVLVGLVVVKGTWLGSHLRLTANKARNWVKSSIPPEQEIARLRMEVRNLKKDDEKHLDKVARLAVDVEKLEKEITGIKDNLAREESRIRELTQTMGDSKFVVYKGQKWTRDDVLVDAMAFKTAEDTLKSKEETLQARRRILAVEKKKLAELQTVRNQMTADLERLEADLVAERSVDASHENTLDDSKYRKLREEMESVRDRIEVLKKKRELRGDFRIPEASSRKQKQTAEAEQFLEARFGLSDKKLANSK